MAVIKGDGAVFVFNFFRVSDRFFIRFNAVEIFAPLAIDDTNFLGVMLPVSPLLFITWFTAFETFFPEDKAVNNFILGLS